jgi:hypothetical protein
MLPERLLRLLAAIAIFGIAGPPIGGLVAWATMGARAMQSPQPFVAGSYAEGFMLALATGMAVASAAWFGKASWVVAVAAAILGNAAIHLSTMQPNLSDPEHIAVLSRVAAVFLPSSVIAALACWFLTRPLLRLP